MDAANSQSGVEVKLSFFPLAFLLLACTPRVEIDGQANKKYWGTHFFPLSAGPHKIRVFFPYIGMPECGANSIDIVVPPGGTVRVGYFMWPWMFAKGTLALR